MKDKLVELEKAGKYVFHGSPVGDLEILEPRQAQTIKDGTHVMADDGKPAVATSPFVDIAIFRAIFNRVNIKENYTSSFSYRNGTLFFSTNKESLEQAKNCEGYVYVFEKQDFYEYSPMEYRSEEPVRPVEVIKVGFEDLPTEDKIEITE